jgi:hypothetical protein
MLNAITNMESNTEGFVFFLQTPSSQVVRGPPTPRLIGCGRDLSEGHQTLPERLMKKVGLSGHDYTGDTTAPYDPAQHLRTRAILGHPSLLDAQSADAAGRMGERGSPPQAQSKVNPRV